MTVFHWPQNAAVLELTKKQVRLSFDTFMAKSRPGLESDEEVKESSPKPKKRQNNKNKKMTEPVRRHDKKEGKERTIRPRSTEKQGQGADPNRGVEQPSLEDRSTSTESSSCEGILVSPLNMPKNIISAVYK